MRARLLILVVLFCPVFRAMAADPAWWTASPTVIDASASHAVEENYAPANIGQLKNFAIRAKDHLHAAYSTGPWSSVDTLVGTFGPDNSVSFTTAEIDAHYEPANLGQLKAVAKVFYDALIAAGYDARKNLRVDRGYPGTWKYFYPFDPYSPYTDNYTPVNLGQLKMVFSFDLSSFNPSSTTDSDGDGLYDVWEIKNGFDPNSSDENGNGIADGSDDFDSDGVSNSTEYANGTNPRDGVSATSPPTQVTDSTNQTQLLIWTPYN